MKSVDETSRGCNLVMGGGGSKNRIAVTSQPPSTIQLKDIQP